MSALLLRAQAALAVPVLGRIQGRVTHTPSHGTLFSGTQLRGAECVLQVSAVPGGLGSPCVDQEGASTERGCSSSDGSQGSGGGSAAPSVTLLLLRWHGTQPRLMSRPVGQEEGQKHDS